MTMHNESGPGRAATGPPLCNSRRKISRREAKKPEIRRHAGALLRGWALLLVGVLLASCAAPEPVETPHREFVIVHTNDFESALHPIDAFWLDGGPEVGGAAHLKTLIDGMRAEESAAGRPLFLLDSGDMFTGLLSRLTEGEVMMEMMMSMGYDAMAIGNHEFDYGSVSFLEQLRRVPFPVLSVNTFHRGTEILYSRPHTILEKNGVRLGVIGVIGEDAASVALPSGIRNLEFRDPEPYLRASVEELRPLVDFIVVLAHQGKTGPMQSDQEVDPEVWRDFDTDIELVRAVPGIDLFLGGHAHRGIDPPFVDPETGTVISQTFGHGTRLGVFRFRIGTDGEAEMIAGGLEIPYTAEHAPDPGLLAKIEAYEEQHRDRMAPIVGELEGRLTRKYLRESSLGHFVADVIREVGAAEVGLTNSGGLRADLPAGEVTRGHIIDALPFLNSVAVMEMSGAQLREVIEQGLSLERGQIQVSGLVVEYDVGRPIGERAVAIRVGDEELENDATYTVAANSFMAEGGDLYSTFVGLPWIREDPRPLHDIVIEVFEEREAPLPVPAPGRLIRVGS